MNFSSTTDCCEYFLKCFFKFCLFLGLIQPVVEGDYQALINVMGYLMNVKDRTEATDQMFQPITETLNLLKFYLVDIPEEINVLLEVRFKLSVLFKDTGFR